MRLLKFRVKNFRSVEDSGWIEVDDVTALIGVNESGKTNLLLPLWKLNPAKEGEVNLLADAPRKRYNELKNAKSKPEFIEALFEIDDGLVDKLTRLTGASPEDVRVANVARKLDGTLTVGFPNAQMQRNVPEEEVLRLLQEAKAEIDGLVPATKAEEPMKSSMREVLDGLVANHQGDAPLSRDILKKIAGELDGVDTAGQAKRSSIAPRFGRLVDELADLIAAVSKPSPGMSQEARNLVAQHMPVFVYYSNYGNLDSEIYLPHVIENLEREDLGGREAAKARTLKVLFDFVRLKPQEILELGKDLPGPVPGYSSPEPTEEAIAAVAAKKKEREILLQSASAELSAKFRDWWKQGEYRIRFDADGNHFRIWVSDDQRPEEIELEGRSTGMQWFLSFYLIFLVESGDAHEGSILLLDEPGLSLHPLAQKDLSRFFENLAPTNQLLYTTHSPFLVDSDHLDRVRSVYVDSDGQTVASSNLRADQNNAAQTKSIYAVHAALGLATSDIMLQGFRPVMVEGVSDQYYLSTSKNYLIREGLISPHLELVFVPAGGAKGVTATVAILAAKDDDLPVALLDADAGGRQMADQLAKGQYQGSPDRILSVGDYCSVANAEIEDLLPARLFADVVTKYLRGPEDDFSDVMVSGLAILPQVEAYAAANGIPLEPGWKVELARRFKQRALKHHTTVKAEADTINAWQTLFAAFDEKGH